MWELKGPDFEIAQSWDLNCYVLAMWPEKIIFMSLSFPHLKHGDNIGTHFMGLFLDA